MAIAKKTLQRKVTNKPQIAFRSRGVSVAVFANEVETQDGRTVTLYNISVHRRYRDGDEYKTTTAFRRDDLPVLQLLTQRAWDFIVDEEMSNSVEEDDTELAE